MARRAPEDDRRTVAPPPASLAPASLARAVAKPPPAAAAAPPVAAAPAPRRADAGETPERASYPVSFVLLVLVAGSVDFGLAMRPLPSVALTSLLSLAVVPWAFLLLRRDRLAQARAAGALGRWFVHIANLLLVLAFLGAKWLVLLRASASDAASLVGSYRTYTVAVVALLALGVAVRGGRAAVLLAASSDHPARLMAASFGFTALLGALLLALPVSLRNVSALSFYDSLFMSVSAVCVTGLATVNVADTYTFTGQIVLAALMQVGGLGIMVLTAAVTLLAGRRLAIKSSAALADLVDARSLADLKRTISMIVCYTLIFEAIGAGLLYANLAGFSARSFWFEDAGALAGSESALWASVFHSISAFCNGSLSNFRAGLIPFASAPAFCQTMLVLIVLGGLGFPVIHELLFRAVDRLRGRRPLRLTLNTRIALTTGAGLFVGIAVLTFVLESGASFAALGVVDRLNAAVFHSACARTSGFNLVDVAAMRPATLLLTCFAMFVGAGPGSTAGGIKTTTLGVLFATYRGELRGQRPRLFDRTLPEAVVRRAMGVAFLSIALVVAVTFVLLLTERQEPLALLFEVVSAFSTTGMSTGITPQLSLAGRVALMITMLIGRVGPVTVALALSMHARRSPHELPQERVMIG